ncbi:MAG: HdeD family acid-resistance protein [Paracoccaceae bacterium]
MKNWFLWLIAGIISVIGGFFALTNPLAATLTAELLAGYMFIAVGILTVISAFGDQGWGGRIVSILLGIAILLLGISLVKNPLEGALSLTLLVGILMVVLGIFRLVLGLGARSRNVRWILFLAGGLSLLLGFMILSNFPQSAAVVLGMFLAIELLSNGVSLIVLALARKSGEEA